jgi:hypothetical protein
MNQFLIIALFGLAVIYHPVFAAEPSELTVKRTESVDPDTGLKRGVIEEFSRNGTNVIKVIHSYTKGKLVSTGRFIYVNGHSVSHELDADADGFFELRIITPSENPELAEVFHVERDGSLKSASSAKLKDIRQGLANIEEAMTILRKEIEKAAQEISDQK